MIDKLSRLHFTSTAARFFPNNDCPYLSPYATVAACCCFSPTRFKTRFRLPFMGWTIRSTTDCGTATISTGFKRRLCHINQRETVSLLPLQTPFFLILYGIRRSLGNWRDFA